MTQLSPHAISYAAILRVLRDLPDGEEPLTIREAARRADYSVKNSNRAGEWLVGAQLVEPNPEKVAVLTDLGRRSLAAIDWFEHAAEGPSPAPDFTLPAGFIALRHDQIAPGDNARTQSGLAFDDIQEMADSICAPVEGGGIRGILQAPGVRPADPGTGLYPLAFGERRWRGWGLGIQQGRHPAERAYLCPLVEGSDRDLILSGLVENEQQSPLNNLEKGEKYLALVRDHGMDAKAIALDIGKNNPGGVRQVQQCVRVAAEASEEDKQKYRESQGRRAIGLEETFTWTQLRKSVEEGKPKPALDLTPTRTLALVELAHAALRRPELQGGRLTEPGYVRLAAPPTAGPLNELWQGFGGAPKVMGGMIIDGACYMRVLTHSTKAGEYLAAIHFDADPDACLYTWQETVKGAIHAHSYRKEGRYVTAELNLPAETAADLSAAAPKDPPPDAAEAARGGGGPSAEEPMVEGAEARSGDDQDWSFNAPAERETITTGAQVFDPRQSHPSDAPPDTPGAAGASPQPGVPGGGMVPDLTPYQRLILTELAHKFDREAFQPVGKPYSVVRIGHAHRDADASRLVQQPTAFIAFLPSTHGLGAAFSPSGQAWRWRFLPPDQVEAKLAAARADANLSAEAAARIEAGGYAVDWLNDPTPPQETALRAAPGGGGPRPAEGVVEGAEASTGLAFEVSLAEAMPQIIDAAALSDALIALYDAAEPILDILATLEDVITNQDGVIDGQLQLGDVAKARLTLAAARTAATPAVEHETQRAAAEGEEEAA